MCNQPIGEDLALPTWNLIYKLWGECPEMEIFLIQFGMYSAGTQVNLLFFLLNYEIKNRKNFFKSIMLDVPSDNK